MAGCLAGAIPGCFVGGAIDAGKLVAAGVTLTAAACAASPGCRKAVQDMMESGKEAAKDFLAEMNESPENQSESGEAGDSGLKELAGAAGTPAPDLDDDDNGLQGHHDGFKKQVEKYSEKSLKKAQKTFDKRIEEHLDKIRNQPNSQSVNHWQKEIRNFRAQKQIIEREMKSRGLI